MNPIMNTQCNETPVSEARRGRTNCVPFDHGSRILMRLVALVMVLCGWTARAADVNILIIGSQGGFSPVGIKTELENILSGAGKGTVNVAFEDYSKQNPIGSNTYKCNDLATWFHWPYPEDVEKTTRWPNLRGENGTDWDYVILIGDPENIETVPGMYAQGVANISAEVAKGGGETVLLMPWPSATSTSTVSHYREVVYRVGRSGGGIVAPAALAWQAAGSPRGTTHPSAHGAYIAAATVFSSIWGESAAVSSYTYDDNLAAMAFNTVEANKGAPQYSGKFTFNSSTLMLDDKRRDVFVDRYDSSTERYFWNAAKDAMQNDIWVNNVTTGEMLWYLFRSASSIGTYNFSFNYGAQGATVLIDDAQDLQKAAMHYDKSKAVSLSKTNSTLRMLPTYYLYADISRYDPNLYPKDAGWEHYTMPMRRAGGVYLATLTSGRCPLWPKPDPVTLDWIYDKVAYETAWRMGRCQTRAPGFKVLPSSRTAKSVTPTTAETMSVQFILPPQDHVTVSVAVDTASAAIVNPKQLTFTPGNHDIAQYVKVVGLPGAAGAESFAVTFNSTSNDEVYKYLSDSWAYTNNRSSTQTLAMQTLADRQVSLLKNTSATVPLNVSGSAQTNTTIAQPFYGTLSWSGADVIYTPNADYHGADSFAYAVNIGGTLTKGYVIITVEDLPKITIAETDGDTVVTEGGAADTYLVTINKAPAAGVSVAVTGDAQATVSPGNLSFTTGNWNVPQTVTVTAVSDGAHELLHSGNIGHTTSSSAPEWNGLTHDLAVTVRDDDNQAPVVEAGPDQVVTLITDGSAGGGAPVAGAYYEWDAAADPAGDDVWSSLSGNVFDLVFQSGQPSPVAVKDARFTKLTNAYPFPAAKSTKNGVLEVAGHRNSPATFEFVLDVDGSDGSILHTGNGEVGLQVDIIEGVLRGTVFANVSTYNFPVRASWPLTPDDMGRYIHVVFVVDQASDLIQLYVDGDLKDSQPWLDGSWTKMDGASLSLGSVESPLDTWPLGGSGADFSGKIALFRFYSDRALAPQEIATNFNSLSTGKSATVNLDGTVTDSDNDPLTHIWSTASTAGLAAFGNPSAIDTTATFTTPGVYTLRLASNDGQETVHDELTVTVIGPQVIKQALIYEPFEQNPGALLGQPASGTGLNRNWGASGYSLVVQSGGLGYGNLPVTGKSVTNSGRRNCNHAEIDDSLLTAGLLEHGAELWFSLLHKIAPANNANAQLSFALTSDRFTTATPSTLWTGNDAGIGFRIAKGDELRAAAWVRGAVPQMSEDSTAVDLVPTGAQFGRTVLIVGKITWGATNSALDRVELYLPNANFELGPVVSTVSATIDQSTLDTLAIGGPFDTGGDCQHIDEIRFDASYDNVLKPGYSVDDHTSPTPDPMTWASPPASAGESRITMTATTATDNNGVEYYFTETSGNPGGSDSGWQDSPTYTDTGLNPSTTYNYTVKARDKSIQQNENAQSSPAAPATTAPADTIAPATPTFATPPTAISSTGITMTAGTVTDPSGVRYYFTETSGNPGGSNSGWQDSPIYTDTGLNPSTTYSYTVKARDKSYQQNETVQSSAASATTPADTTAPATPAFATPPTAISSTEITMTARTVTDPSGVQYYFTETSGNPGGSDSGWQDSPLYTDTGLNPSTTYSYRVKARDKSAALNASAPSAALDAITQGGGPAVPVIYEPFAQPSNATNDASLTPQATSGIGITGNWATNGEGSMKVANGSLSYGGLATSGNFLRNSGRRQGNFAGINSALSNAGLLADGRVLWFSLLHKLGSANNTNANFGFALGTDAMRYVNDSQGIPFNGTGAGVGFRIANTDQLTAAIWTPGTAPNINAGPAVDLTPGGIGFNTTVLIVGKVTWGANGATADTVDLYLPDTSLKLGPVVSTVSVMINQSTLDNITFCGSLTAPADYYNIDEIRVGARYWDVSPFPVVEAPTIISHVPADGAGSVSPAADLVATFSEPIVLTGNGTVTIVDTDDGSDTRTINLPDPGVSATGSLLTINPATNLGFGRNYAVRISGDAIEDVDSGVFAGISNNTTWNFQITGQYDNWATGTEPFGGDANGDGVTDGMAWILGAASPSANANDKLPVPAKDGAFLTLSFKRVNPYSPAKLYVEYGSDLGGWTGHEIPAASNPNIGGGIEVVVVDNLPDPDQVTVKLPTSLQSPAGTLFVRLRAASN